SVKFGPCLVSLPMSPIPQAATPTNSIVHSEGFSANSLPSLTTYANIARTRSLCPSTHSDYRGQRLYRPGHTPAESICANASLSSKREILGVFAFGIFATGAEFFSLRLSLQCLG